MANEIVQTVPFTFDEIYSSLITKLGNDAPYEGSNLAILMTSMSYLVSMLNVNTAANLNEMFLPLARKRENVLEGARLLGYEPSKSSSYRYKLELNLKKYILEADKILIEKYTKFVSGSNSYYYMGEDPVEIFGSIGQKFYLEVIQGELKSFIDEPSLTQYIGTEIDAVTNYIVPTSFIDLPFESVEENGIELFLSYIDNYGNQVSDEKWTKSNTFMVDRDTSFKKEFLRIDNIDFGTPRLYFKYAGIGNTILAGSIVKANILITKGSEGIADLTFTIPDITLAAALDVIDFSVVSQGTINESIESIQRNAPLFYNTANRVITASDYESFCNRDTRIKNSKVWGGEDEFPLRPGELWFTFLPQTFVRSFTSTSGNLSYSLNNALDTVNLFLEDKEIRSNDSTKPGIWDILDLYRIPTMKLHNRHPVLLNFEYDIKILKYNITQSRAVTNDDIFKIIDNYFKENVEVDTNGQDVEYLEKFDIEYFNSNLIKRIDSYLSDNSGFSLTLTNNITCFKQNLSKENYFEQTLNLANMDLFIQFYIPFEDIFNTGGELIPEILPNIFTHSFLAGGLGGDISVDWTGVTGKVDLNPLIQTNILHNGSVVGTYSIHNESKKFITINLFVQDNTVDSIDPVTLEQILPTGKYLASTLRKTDFNTPQTLNVKFFSPNLKTYKNTIPRLKRVTFL